MKIKTDLIKNLISKDNPIPNLFEYLKNEIWLPNENLSKFYEQEKTATELERFLTRTYDELYTDILPKRCVEREKKPALQNPTVFLDCLSIREGILLQKTFDDKGFETTLSFSLSGVPSTTSIYKEKIEFSELQKEVKFKDIKKLEEWKMDGNEQLIWADFPDALFESLSKGKTVIATVETAYEKIENLALRIVKNLEADKVEIRSDHGYVRHQPAYTLRIEKGINQIRSALGGKRFASTEDVSDLPSELERYLVKYNGFYMAKSRYVWPVSGKYSVLQHGGISLMECLTPVLKISKPSS